MVEANNIPMLEMDPGVFPEPKIPIQRTFETIQAPKFEPMDIKMGFSDYMNIALKIIKDFPNIFKAYFLFTHLKDSKMDVNQTIDSGQKIANLIFPYIFSDTEIVIINKAVDDDQAAVSSTIALVQMVEAKFGKRP